MMKFKWALAFPLLGNLILTGCETAPKEYEQDFLKYKLKSMFEAFELDNQMEQKLMPIFEEAVENARSDNSYFIAALARYYHYRDEPEKKFYFYKKLATQPKARENHFFTLACFYWNGIGTPIDKNEAMNWMHKAANKGSNEARFFLSEAYKQGLTGYKNQADAQYWETRAYGALYHQNIFSSPNTSPDLKIYFNLSQSDCGPILKNLADEHLEKAAKQEGSKASALYRKFEKTTIGQDILSEASLKLLKEASELGDLNAQNDLAQYYNQENTPHYAPEKAIKWLKRSAHSKPRDFYYDTKLAELLWADNKHSEAVFWYAFVTDQYPSDEELNDFHLYLNFLTPEERKDFDLMYKNWAYKGILP
jgi:TPR repeat protein